MSGIDRINRLGLAIPVTRFLSPGRVKVSYPVYLLTKDEFDYGETVEESFKGYSRKIRVCELDAGADA